LQKNKVRKVLKREILSGINLLRREELSKGQNDFLGKLEKLV